MSGSINEPLTQGRKQFKTQRLLPVVGHTFLVSDSTPTFDDMKTTAFDIPSWINKMLGLKEKIASNSNSTTAAKLAYLYLLIAVLLSSAYPLLIHQLDGNAFERLYNRYLVIAVLLLPIVFFEMKAKSAEENVFHEGVLTGKSILKIYFNSLFLTLWNVFFCLSLKYTALSTTLYYSHLMLLLWGLNRLFRRSAGISEWGVNGIVLFILGLLIFSLKNWLTHLNEERTTSLYVEHSVLGVFFAIAASFAAVAYFINNYDLTYYLPSYTSLLSITIFSMINLELITLGLSFLYPAQYPLQFLTISCSLLLLSH